MKIFREYHLEQLKDAEDAKEYLDAALEDGNKEAFFYGVKRCC